VICLPLLVMVSAVDAGENLQAGAGTVVITPPLGVPLAGYYHKRGASGVHDDLFARAIVLRKADVTAAFVSLDLISTRRGFVEKARELIEERTGIPAAHVMISATHAHTGPVLTESRLYDDQGATESTVVAFTNTLPDKIAQSVADAYDRLQDVEVLSAVGTEGSIAFNRRFHMRDGTVGWNPGKRNPDIIKPAGPIDPQVPVVYFRTARTEHPLAVYVNYSVHLDNVGGDQISADLPFTVTENLRKAVGSDLVTVYTSGACGDLNHVDVTWAASQKGHENAARMGTILSGEVLKAWRNLEPVDGLLQVKTRMVELAIPKVSAEAVKTAEEIVKSMDDSNRRSFMQLVHAHKVLDVAAREDKPFEVEVQVITLGDALAWVALPGEIFVELGLDLKSASPFKQTMVAELANGSIGYVPTSRAYRQGAYEVVSARCVAGSGEVLVNAALDLLTECYSAAITE
jgi:neutral ceramidase